MPDFRPIFAGGAFRATGGAVDCTCGTPIYLIDRADGLAQLLEAER